MYFSVFPVEGTEYMMMRTWFFFRGVFEGVNRLSVEEAAEGANGEGEACDRFFVVVVVIRRW